MSSLVSEGTVEANAAPAAYRPPADGSHFDGDVDLALGARLLFIQGIVLQKCIIKMAL